MPDSLYETDILAWSHAQADRLRRVAAGERVNDLDWANVIEEIESVGRSEVKAVRSFLGLAILHGLKIQGWPDHQAVLHWLGEIANFLVQAKHRFELGMTQNLDIDDIFADALARVGRLGLGPLRRQLPAGIALSPAALLASDFGAEDLVAALRVTP